MYVPSSDLPRVVVVGGGFAGLNFVQALANKPFQIVLIDRHNYHNFQPLMYQIATAGLMPDSIVAPFRKIFGRYPNVFFRLGEVENIDARGKILQTDNGALPYDHLVLATGATTNFFGMERVMAAALPLKSVPDALNIRSALLQKLERYVSRPEKANSQEVFQIVIVGGGPTGLEMAGSLAELRHNEIKQDYPDFDTNNMQICLVEMSDELLPPMSGHASEKSLHYLKEMNVEVMLGTAIKDYVDNKVVLSSGRHIQTDILIYAAGVKADLPQGLDGAEWGRGGRLMVDGHFRVQGLKDIYALGDAAARSEEYGGAHPMLAQPAIQQGKYLARMFDRGFDNSKPFKYQDYGTMATIGKNKAVADLKVGKFHGFIAWAMWLFVHLMSLVSFRNRLQVFTTWATSYFSSHKYYRLIIRPYERKYASTVREKSDAEQL
ncbi:MAG TPA: NAD(P)/FAD-dependent oxidoreductase [Saprospiraceae bacterium]|nr:NAD(P)/FAD-dependent oxidoreductase [Saprospiraceae bacterium]